MNAIQHSHFAGDQTNVHLSPIFEIYMLTFSIRLEWDSTNWDENGYYKWYRYFIKGRVIASRIRGMPGFQKGFVHKEIPS